MRQAFFATVLGLAAAAWTELADRPAALAGVATAGDWLPVDGANALDTAAVVVSDALALTPALEEAGWAALTDAAFVDGAVFAALEDETGALGAVARFDAATLALQAVGDPLPQLGAGWLAADEATGLLYTSEADTDTLLVLNGSGAAVDELLLDRTLRGVAGGYVAAGQLLELAVEADFAASARFVVDLAATTPREACDADSFVCATVDVQRTAMYGSGLPSSSGGGSTTEVRATTVATATGNRTFASVVEDLPGLPLRSRVFARDGFGAEVPDADGGRAVLAAWFGRADGVCPFADVEGSPCESHGEPCLAGPDAAAPALQAECEAQTETYCALINPSDCAANSTAFAEDVNGSPWYTHDNPCMGQGQAESEACGALVDAYCLAHADDTDGCENAGTLRLAALGNATLVECPFNDTAADSPCYAGGHVCHGHGAAASDACRAAVEDYCAGGAGDGEFALDEQRADCGNWQWWWTHGLCPFEAGPCEANACQLELCAMRLSHSEHDSWLECSEDLLSADIAGSACHGYVTAYCSSSSSSSDPACADINDGCGVGLADCPFAVVPGSPCCFDEMPAPDALADTIEAYCGGDGAADAACVSLVSGGSGGSGGEVLVHDVSV